MKEIYEYDAGITFYQGTLPIGEHCCTVNSEPAALADVCRVKWEGSCTENGMQGNLIFTFEKDLEKPAAVFFRLRILDWNRENYLLMPAAVYNGNRYSCVDVKYPPFVPEEFRTPSDAQVKITDIPRLSDTEDQSEIQLLSGDLSAPMIAFYNPIQKTGCLLQTTHRTFFGYQGLFVKEDLQKGTADLLIHAPGVREEYYYHMTNTKIPSDDEGVLFQKGDRVELPLSVCFFPCNSIHTLFETVFENRYGLETHQGSRCVVPFSKAFASIEQRFEEAYYSKEERFYGLGDRNGHQFWQTGWVGGGMAGYPLMCRGTAEVLEHSVETLDFLFSKLQTPNGWLRPMYLDGKFYGDTLKFFLGEKESPEEQEILLIRKNADALYFILKQIQHLKKIGRREPKIRNGAKKLCDAFVNLWNQHHQLGQFIQMDTNEILIGGTAAGAITGASLTVADQVFGGYLTTAEEITRYYCHHYLDQGLLNGGPGEIMQCPDSESSFGLLESCVALYCATKKEEWKIRAQQAAYHAASWVISYDFEFPKKSVDSRFDMRTTGTVFANAQNKHSAPGICTLSGVSLLWLYRATKKPEFLQLLCEITRGVMQFVQTDNRLFPTLTDPNPTPGCACERVQTSDWEGKDAVGEIAAPSSVWPEVSALLITAEIPSIYLDLESNRLAVFDHLEASFSVDTQQVTILNPTSYDAYGEIWIDRDSEELIKIPFSIFSGSTVKVTIS